jgi:thiol-disulfide isomerase/thioredoxin
MKKGLFIFLIISYFIIQVFIEGCIKEEAIPKPQPISEDVYKNKYDHSESPWKELYEEKIRPEENLDLKIEDIDGNSIRFSDYKGKIIIVNFWTTWCAACRKEISYLTKLYESYKKQEIEIIGICIEEDQRKIKFWKNYKKIPYIILQGDEKLESTFGGIDVIPTTFILDQSGKISKTIIGSPKDLSIFEEHLRDLLE